MGQVPVPAEYRHADVDHISADRQRNRDLTEKTNTADILDKGKQTDGKRSFPGKYGRDTGKACAPEKNFCASYREAEAETDAFRSKYRKAELVRNCAEIPLTNVHRRSIILYYYS